MTRWAIIYPLIFIFGLVSTTMLTSREYLGAFIFGVPFILLLLFACGTQESKRRPEYRKGLHR